MTTIPETIEKLYEKTGFLDNNGMDLYITLFLIITTTTWATYYGVKSNAKPIVANWVNERCKPEIMPIAGMINGEEGVSSMEYTQQNFSGCVYNIIQSSIGTAFSPVYYKMNVFGGIFSSILGTLSKIRAEINSMVSALLNIFADLFSKVMNMFVPLLPLLYKIQDTIARLGAIFLNIVYLFLSGMIYLGSVIINAYILMVVIVVLLWGLWAYFFYQAVALWAASLAFPPLAVPAASVSWIALGMSMFILPIVVLLTIVAVSIGEIFGGAVAKPPSSGPEEFTLMKDKPKGIREKFKNMKKDMPVMREGFNLMKERVKLANKGKKVVDACFGRDTEITLKDGIIKKIHKLKVGDTLHNNSKVTTWMELSTYGQQIYELNNTIVTGNHRVLYNDMWIEVKKHPDSIIVEDYRDSMLYCFNTDNKQIHINGNIYTDWDDLDDMDIIDLYARCESILHDKYNKSDIHKYLDNGFTKDTKIELESGNYVNICDVEVNDILKFGERVVGKVKINARDMNSINEYYLEDKSFRGSSNLQIDDPSLGIISTIELDGVSIKKENKLYHLLTDTGRVYINGIHFGDYNSGIENHMDDESINILSILS